MEIKTIEVTPFAQNARLLWKKGEGDALLIDPGGDADRILLEAKALGVKIREVWLTHSHIDHCGGVARILELTGAALVGNPHPIEREMRARVCDIARMYGLPQDDIAPCPEPARMVSGGETMQFAGVDFQVLFTPGHSPGHLCFYAPSEGFVLAGDTLFAGSIGRTDLPGGEHETLLRSIREKLFPLPPETRVLSGHGPDTTIGREKRGNPFVGDGANG